MSKGKKMTIRIEIYEYTQNKNKLMFGFFFIQFFFLPKNTFSLITQISISPLYATSQMVNGMNEIFKQCKKGTPPEGFEASCESFTNVDEAIFTDGSDLNSDLEKVSEKSHILNIMSANFQGFSGKIDFKKLKSRNAVSFTGVGNTNLQIYGGIKDKVSQLVISNCKVEILENNLDCQTVYFEGVTLVDNDYIVDTEIFITGYSSFDTLQAGKYKYKTLLLNIGISIDNSKFRIAYSQSAWKVQKTNGENSDIYNDAVDVPYTDCETFGVLFYPDYFDVINIGEPSVYKALNLTFLQNIIPGLSNSQSTFPFSLENEKKVIKVTATNWENKESKPKIYFTYNSDETIIDYSDFSDFETEEILVSNAGNGGGNNDKNSKFPTWGIAVIVVGVVVIVAIIIVVVVVVKKKQGIANTSE